MWAMLEHVLSLRSSGTAPHWRSFGESLMRRFTVNYKYTLDLHEHVGFMLDEQATGVCELFPLLFPVKVDRELHNQSRSGAYDSSLKAEHTC